MSIVIRKSETADTRTCDFANVSKETLLASTHQHIGDVRAGLEFFQQMLAESAQAHDTDKITDLDGFHADFVTGFKEQGWWDRHRKLNRHHLTKEDGIPADVNLIDVLDFIADCVMAGMARSGSVYPLELPPELLERAFQNTVERLKREVVVAAEAPETEAASEDEARYGEQARSLGICGHFQPGRVMCKLDAGHEGEHDYGPAAPASWGSAATQAQPQAMNDTPMPPGSEQQTPPSTADNFAETIIERLEELIAKSGGMTRQQRDAQRQSFAHGNCAIDNPEVTREAVAAEAESLSPEEDSGPPWYEDLERDRIRRLNYRRLLVEVAAGLGVAMVEKGLSTKELAEKSGLSKSKIKRYLSGKCDIPIRHLADMATAMGVQIDLYAQQPGDPASKELIKTIGGEAKAKAEWTDEAIDRVIDDVFKEHLPPSVCVEIGLECRPPNEWELSHLTDCQRCADVVEWYRSHHAASEQEPDNPLPKWLGKCFHEGTGTYCLVSKIEKTHEILYAVHSDGSCGEMRIKDFVRHHNLVDDDFEYPPLPELSALFPPTMKTHPKPAGIIAEYLTHDDTKGLQLWWDGEPIKPCNYDHWVGANMTQGMQINPAGFQWEFPEWEGLPVEARIWKLEAPQ